MSHVDCYATRLLNPYRGTKQIVSTKQARATSTDGITWRIQIRQDIYKTPWSSLAIPEQDNRYFVYGNWSLQQGLTPVPVHPSLYETHVLEAVEKLLAQLKPASQQLPFALKDRLELWLMDSEARAVALLASQLPEEQIPEYREIRWYAAQDAKTQEQFDLALRRRCKASMTTYWIERQADNSGVILHGHAGKQVSRPPTLPASAFPVCLLDENWPDAQTSQLISEYQRWQAPVLLMLPLPAERRRILENQAQQRPLVVQRYHHLYPAIEDTALLKKILVEAVMRTAASSN